MNKGNQNAEKTPQSTGYKASGKKSMISGAGRSIIKNTLAFVGAKNARGKAGGSRINDSVHIAGCHVENHQQVTVFADKKGGTNGR
jgi:hypothetical protein